MSTRALLLFAFAAAAAAQPYPGAPTFTRSLAGLDLRAMVAAPDGSIAVGGVAKAAGLPATANALQAELNPTICGVIPGPGLVPNPCGDGYFARFDRSGALVYGTYLGGAGQDEVAALALRANGDLYVAGLSRSPEIAAGRGPFVLQLHADAGRGFATGLSNDPDRMPAAIALSKDGVYVAGQFAGEPWLAKLDLDSGAVLFTRSLPTSGYETVSDLAVDDAGNAYVAGPVSLVGVFVTKVAPDGRVLSSITFGETFDSLDRISIAPNGDVLAAGTTASPKDPVGATAGWLKRLPAELTTPGSTTLLDIYTQVSAILPQTDGSVLLFGNTQSNFFPVTPDATERCPAPAFFARLSPDGGHVVYASFLSLPGGERGLLRAAMADSAILLAGAASVSSIAALPQPAPTRLCAVQSASFGNFLTYTGEYVTIFGSGLNPRQVLVNGTPADLVYVSPSQVNMLVPPLPAAKTLHIEVEGAGTIDAPAVDRAPGLFRVYGTYLAAALADARAGRGLTLFGTGFGPAPRLQVYFGPTEAPVQAVSTEGGLTRIEVSIPDLPPGRYPVNFLSDNGFQLGLVEIVLP